MTKHCPLRGIVCDGEKCELWYRNDIYDGGIVVNREEGCSIRQIAKVLSRL